MFSSGPRYEKLKTNLRLSINRMKLLQKKKTEQALKARKEIADFISAGKVDRARIRVEHIIREDYLVEVLEILEMYCDLLLARFGVIQNMKEMDPSLEEPIFTLLWCAPRLFTDVQELKPVAEQFTLKYTKKYVEEYCRSDECCKANPKVRAKLSVAAPPPALVERYLIEIAKTYNTPFEPDQHILAQAECVDGTLIDLGSVPTPMNAAQFGAGVSQAQCCSGLETGTVCPPGFALMPPQPPPYSAKAEEASANGQMNHNPTYNSASPVLPGWPGYSVTPNAPPAAALPPGGCSYWGSPPPTSGAPSAPFTPQQPPAPYLAPNPNATARSVPLQPPSSNTGGIGFVLPDVPDTIAAPKSGGAGSSNGNTNDVDFDELQRRFDELKKKK